MRRPEASSPEGYAHEYSSGDPAMLDLPARRAQAARLGAILAHYEQRAAGRDTPGSLRCLDIGCSTGVITQALAERYGRAIGIDVDHAALTRPHLRAAHRDSGGCVSVAMASGLSLPFAAESFDVAVCNQVYQYVTDVAQLFSEISRVLAPGGYCLFSARNLYGVMSPQNVVPALAHGAPALVRWLEGRKLLSPAWRHRAGHLQPAGRLRRLAGAWFEVHDYTLLALTEPALADRFLPRRAPRGLVRRLGPLLALTAALFPTHLWVLRKPARPSGARL